jgi:rhodanese-related sulfurtransferase
VARDLPDAYVGMTLAPQQSDVPVIRADQLSSDRYTLLDVRLRPGDRKVAGAVLRPPQELLLSDGIPGIARDSRIAVYGDSESLVSAIVLHLRRNGYLNAAVLQGGFEAWRDCGMPLERISGAQPA